MKKIYLIFLMLLSWYTNKGQTLTIPAAYASTLTGSSFLGLLANTPRTYQLLINQSELTALIGQQLTGITFRSPISLSTATSWPSSTTTYNNYSIYLSESVAPANRSLTFANNIVGTQSTVRSGPLVITPNSFPAGGALSFGSSITFNTPYYYNGGHLLLEIRHSASNGDNRSTDAVPFDNTLFNSALATAYATSETATSTLFGTGGAVTIRFDYGTTLPLHLLRFYGLPGMSANNLYWETSEENNCAYFEIEKSTDGKSFHPSGRIIALNSADKTSYSYTDKEVSSQKTYYRLKMVDQDQSYTYSKIIGIKHDNSQKNKVFVAPNPFNDRFSISLGAQESGTVTVYVNDILGRLHYRRTVRVKKEDQQFEINAEQLPAGLYMLKFQGAINQVFKIQKL